MALQKKSSLSQHNNTFFIPKIFSKHYYDSPLEYIVVFSMGCWKWFNGVLKEAGVQVTEQNKDAIEKIIHTYISEQASYGRCSADWQKARKEINESPEMKKELIEKLKAIV
ncbi:MAG: hypothetical protein QXX34_01835 [Candidatus Bathyarchaeia archaeon]